MAKFPVILYHPDSNDPDKVLRARHQDELEGLMRVGWVAAPDPETRWARWQAKEQARLQKRAELLQQQAAN